MGKYDREYLLVLSTNGWVLHWITATYFTSTDHQFALPEGAVDADITVMDSPGYVVLTWRVGSEVAYSVYGDPAF